MGRSTSMSSFTRVATGPRLPHPARSESPPLVLAVVGAILVYSATRPPLRLVDRPVARLPRRLFALRTERAREQTIRSPFERPTAGGCRPSVADPAPLTRGFSQPRRQDPAVHRANGWSLSAPSPRAPAAKCPSFAGLPSPDSRVLSGKGHSASNRRGKRPSPLTTLPAASLHRILIAGRRSSVAILFVIWLANEYMSTRFQLRLIFLYVILFVLTCFSVK